MDMMQRLSQAGVTDAVRQWRNQGMPVTGLLAAASEWPV